MKFAGVDDRNAAELLVKKDLQVPREDLMPLKNGHYYVFDIIGLSVDDEENHLLGKLTDDLKTGGNDVYEVTDDSTKEQLFAAIPEVGKSIDIEGKKTILNPPEWVDE